MADTPTPTAAPAAAAETNAAPADIKSEISEILSEDVAPEVEAKEEKPEPPSTKKKFKLQVDGEEMEDEIDLSDEEDLKRRLQKARAFEKRSAKWSQTEKQIDKFLKELDENPFEVLKKMGKNPDELAEKHIERLVEQMKKSPEQLEKERIENELKAAKEEAARLKQEKEQAELERMRNEHASQIQEGIIAALDNSSSLLPKRNPNVIRKVANYMLLAMQNGYPQVTAQEVIPMVEQDYRQELKGLFDVLPEDTIEALVGKGNLDRLRKRRLTTHKAKTETAKQIIKDSGKKADAGEDKPKKKVSYKDFFSPFEN